ncbi:MAG: ABC transporter permease subunit [Schleiferiaceae bacterium]
MIGKWLNKLGYTLLVLWGVATLVFLLFSVLPGDPAKMMLDQREDPELLAAIKAKYGLDQPLYVQYGYFLNDLSPISWHSSAPDHFTRLDKYPQAVSFFSTVGGSLAVKWPYLRESFQKEGKSVGSIIAETLPNTMVLAFSSILIAMILGVLIGVISALREGSWIDRLATVLGTLGMSLPSFFTAILIAWIFGFVLSEVTGLSMTGTLRTYDPYGEQSYWSFKNLILPALTLGIRPLGVIIQLTRSSMLEVLQQDYIRTARAKGLSQSQIVRKHALKNALNPVITAASGWFASMLAGAVFVEYIFGWNGLGKQIVEALNQLDVPMVMGAVLVISLLFVAVNAVVDILYAWLDPKVRTR